MTVSRICLVDRRKRHALPKRSCLEKTRDEKIFSLPLSLHVVAHACVLGQKGGHRHPARRKESEKERKRREKDRGQQDYTVFSLFSLVLILFSLPLSCAPPLLVSFFRHLLSVPWSLENTRGRFVFWLASSRCLGSFSRRFSLKRE